MKLALFAALSAIAPVVLSSQSAHAQLDFAPQPHPPAISDFAASLLQHGSEPMTIVDATVESREKPWLYLHEYPNPSRSVDWFQKNGLLFGSMYDGTYSGPIPNRRTTIARDLIHLLAVRGMPSGPWTSTWDTELFAKGFFARTQTRDCARNLIALLEPELAASGVTTEGARSVLNNPKNTDASPAADWAFVATQEMHHAGLLIGD